VELAGGSGRVEEHVDPVLVVVRVPAPVIDPSHHLAVMLNVGLLAQSDPGCVPPSRRFDTRRELVAAVVPHLQLVGRLVGLVGEDVQGATFNAASRPRAWIDLSK
jgi:hypothetical protein